MPPDATKMKTLRVAAVTAGFQVLEKDPESGTEKVVSSFVTEAAAAAWLAHYRRLLDAAERARRTLGEAT